ncbi:MAG: glycosyltransferase family 4 protein [Solobacterium sp.]|nr:glycosyltransferase family 4 protein [Solobacterium sp.]
MKITMFIGSLYGGGAERVTCSLAGYLAEKGHDVEILTMSETKDAYDLDERVSVKTLLSLKERRNTVFNNLIRFPKFWKYLRTAKNDLYIVMLPKTTIMLLMFRWMTKAKVVAAERVDPGSYTGMKATMLKKLAHRADGFVFQTEDAMKWYGNTVSNLKTTVIPNAVNKEFIRPFYTGEKRKVIAAAGRLNAQKNFTLLINAFAKIASEVPDYRLVIYGEGEKRIELEALIRSHGLEDRAALPGNIKNIAEEMQQNDMFVLSSDFEGMPNALMEAMALGLACVSTDCPCGGPAYLIRNDINGILVPVNDEGRMAEAMKGLLKDPEKLRSIGRNAYQISSELTPERIYGRWEEFLVDVLKGS